MHARLNRFEASPERIDESARRTEDVVLPLLRGLEGFQGIVVLADRGTGTQVAISYWESEDAMRASEQAVSQSRQEAADAAGTRSEPIVERYEVVLQA